MNRLLFLICIVCNVKVNAQYSGMTVGSETQNNKSNSTVVINPKNPALKYKSIGFNTNFMLQQILPFNAIPLQQNMYAITYRRYVRNNGTRFSAGVNLSGVDELHWFAARLDYDRRKNLGGKWIYFYGGGLGLEFFEDPNEIGFFNSTSLNLLGQLHWGVEYNCNEIVSLSIESQGQLMLGFNSALRLRPPTVITAHFKLP